MPDYSKCFNEECKMKNDCFRYMVKPYEYGQSWCKFEPISDNNCTYFIEWEPYKKYTKERD